MSSMPKTNGKPDIRSLTKAVQNKTTNNVLHFLVIRDETDFENAHEVMEYLMLNTPDTPDNPYHDFMILLGQALEAYEQEHYPVAKPEPIEMLRFLMEQQNVRQADLVPVLGSRSLVSELLSGKRKLNKRHIEVLSPFFHVSPATFFG
jgi:HTH-type transcriptional regulator/antitoxin HigA